MVVFIACVILNQIDSALPIFLFSQCTRTCWWLLDVRLKLEKEIQKQKDFFLQQNCWLWQYDIINMEILVLYVLSLVG